MPIGESNVVIRCLTKGICSYDFRLEGGGRQADLRLEWLVEQGSIETGNEVLEVRKHGPLSGHWTLENGGSATAWAQKSNVVTRTFELEDSMAMYTLHARSALGRSFRILKLEQEVASIKPDHPWTRRATIVAHFDSVEFTTLAFAFWLVVLTWRRGDGASS